MSTAPITLDSPALTGQLRNFGRGSHFVRRAKSAQPQGLSEARSQSRTRHVSNTRPAAGRQTKSQVLQRSITTHPQATPVTKSKNKTRYSALASLLAGVTLLLIGLGAIVTALRMV